GRPRRRWPGLGRLRRRWPGRRSGLRRPRRLTRRSRARTAVRSELVEVAAALLRRCAVALRLLWLLVFHRSLHTGDARQVTRELLPLSGELFGPGAVLLHHFLRSALDEPRIVESLAQSLQLRLGACDLLLDTSPLRREVDQAREREMDFALRLCVGRGLPWARRVKSVQRHLAGVGEVLERALVPREDRGILGEKDQRHALVRGKVHLAAHGARAVDGARDHVHLPLGVLVAGAGSRKRREHDGGAAAVGKALPDLLRHERHERMQQAQRALQRRQERVLRSGALSRRLLSVERRLAQLDRPVAQLVPDEAVDAVRRVAELEFVERAARLVRTAVEAAEDPAIVDARGL